jgi:hypothetical protein
VLISKAAMNVEQAEWWDVCYEGGPSKERTVTHHLFHRASRGSARANGDSARAGASAASANIQKRH